MSRATEDIAIIGMSCRFPGVNDLPTFWNLLFEGRSTVGQFPPDRPGHSELRSHPEGQLLASGSFFEQIDQFDAEFFGVGPEEAVAMDPVQRLALELAWEAVEDARIAAPDLAGSRTDVLVGAASSGYEMVRRLAGSDRDDPYAALGSGGALVANRISALFDVRGASLSTDSGQSSSLVSVALACDRMRSGTSTLAIVGGVNLIADPLTGTGLANLGALSPDGRCFAFDERANGFVRGEGGAFVVLKPLSAAQADEDRIYATIRGWAVGSAGSSVKMPDPSPAAQAASIRAALVGANLQAVDVDYVECHGTGTRLGDPAEIAGIAEVFGQKGLYVGSVKTNVGHLEAAAGVTGLVKAALCIREEMLVKSVNFRRPNPLIPELGEKFEVLGGNREWTGARRAGVSSFGMGGTNTHVVLEAAAPTPASIPALNARVLPWVVSARSETGLRAQAARLAEYAGAHEPVDVGYSLLRTRSQFRHRAVVLGQNGDQLLRGLKSLADGHSPAGVVQGEVPGRRTSGPIVLVFPGQGSQWPGMAERLYAQSPVFAQALDECAQALAPWVDWSLIDSLRGQDLDRVDVVQPTLFAVMVSLARLWRSLGVEPDVVVGHSQGEIAAACVAGALSLEDAARLVALRSRALRGLSGAGGGMSVVSAPVHEVQLQEWQGRLNVAAVNGPSSVLISGDESALDAYASRAEQRGIRVRRVRVDYASHSHHVERLREDVLEAGRHVRPRSTTSVQFYSTVTGQAMDTAGLDQEYWYQNLRGQVRFAEVMKKLRQPGAVFVEVAPHPVLQGAIGEAEETHTSRPVVVDTLRRDHGGLEQVLQSLAELHVSGVPVMWDAVFAGTRPQRIGLPTYAFQRQRYWLTATSQDRQPAAAKFSSEQEVLQAVFTVAAEVLEREPEQIEADEAVTFKDLGLDSAMAVRLRNRIGTAVGVHLSATVAYTYPTPQALGRYVLSVMGLPQETPSPAGDEELFALIERGYA